MNAAAAEGRLANSVLAAWALPTVGLTAMQWLVMVLLVKFSTDHLGLEPALVGGLFALARIWDAFTDPLAGWASDRTRSPFGRRRPWMFAAALPLGLGFWMLWSVPVGAPLEIVSTWMGGALFLFFAALTAFKIPHHSLGAELSSDHHERTRISAAQMGADAIGIAASLALIHGIENAGDPRAAASLAAGGLGLVSAIAIVFCCSRIDEAPVSEARTGERPLAAALDVLRNPHALRVALAHLFAELGLGALLVAMPFVAVEMSGQEGQSAFVLLGFAIPFALSIPLWVPIARRIGKVRAWMAGCAVTALGFLSMSFLRMDELHSAIFLAGIIGFGQAGMRTMPFAVKADVIDWDEAKTGERKEGSYFAAWNLVDKCAAGVAVLLVGFAIQAPDGGIDPQGLQFALSVMPAGFVCLSILVLLGLRLDEREHAAVRATIERRRARAAAASEEGEATTAAALLRRAPAVALHGGSS